MASAEDYDPAELLPSVGLTSSATHDERRLQLTRNHRSQDFQTLHTVNKAWGMCSAYGVGQPQAGCGFL